MSIRRDLKSQKPNRPLHRLRPEHPYISFAGEDPKVCHVMQRGAISLSLLTMTAFHALMEGRYRRGNSLSSQ